MKQVDNEAAREALKATEAKVDSFREKNDSELQSIRELIEVRCNDQLLQSLSLRQYSDYHYNDYTLNCRIIIYILWYESVDYSPGMGSGVAMICR